LGNHPQHAITMTASFDQAIVSDAAIAAVNSKVPQNYQSPIAQSPQDKGR
jgi:hypothetical protein